VFKIRSPKIECSGGLGNQLFLWNLAHILAKKYDCKVEIFYNKIPDHNQNRLVEINELSDHCSHNIKVRGRVVIPFILKLHDKIRNSQYFKINFIPKILKLTEINDPWGSPNFSENPSRIYRGFYQNMELFRNAFPLVKDEILALMGTKIYQISSNLGFDLNVTKYQALHIRRGDYLENKETIGVLSLDFYKKSLAYDLQTLISCDDGSYLYEIKDYFPKVQVIDPKIFNTWQSFSILAHSQRIIIANSTFSWWAAQFVLNRNGQVIAPIPWYKNLNAPYNYLENNKFTYIESEFIETLN